MTTPASDAPANLGDKIGELVRQSVMADFTWHVVIVPDIFVAPNSTADAEADIACLEFTTQAEVIEFLARFTGKRVRPYIFRGTRILTTKPPVHLLVDGVRIPVLASPIGDGDVDHDGTGWFVDGFAKTSVELLAPLSPADMQEANWTDDDIDITDDEDEEDVDDDDADDDEEAGEEG